MQANTSQFRARFAAIAEERARLQAAGHVSLARRDRKDQLQAIERGLVKDRATAGRFDQSGLPESALELELQALRR